jgi:hypothetical protein
MVNPKFKMFGGRILLLALCTAICSFIGFIVLFITVRSDCDSITVLIENGYVFREFLAKEKEQFDCIKGVSKMKAVWPDNNIGVMKCKFDNHVYQFQHMMCKGSWWLENPGALKDCWTKADDADMVYVNAERCKPIVEAVGIALGYVGVVEFVAGVLLVLVFKAGGCITSENAHLTKWMKDQLRIQGGGDAKYKGEEHEKIENPMEKGAV